MTNITAASGAAPADICKPFGYVRDNCGDGHVFQHAPFSESEGLVHSTAEVYSRAQMLSALSASASTPAEDGYATAFYEIASVLGIGARADTPENVFRNEMLPKIAALASREAANPAGPVMAQGNTVYQLNDLGWNRWMLQVQPGRDDNDGRVSDAECVAVAQRIVAALNAPVAGLASRETSPAPLTDEQIERLAVEHDSVDERGYTTYGFGPEGLASFVRAVLALASPQVAPDLSNMAEVWALSAADLEAGPDKTSMDHYNKGVAAGIRQCIADCTRLAAPAPVAPQPTPYVDSNPQLHVGESSFEDWYQNYLPNSVGHKQIARDAYAAGMGDPLVAPQDDARDAARYRKMRAWFVRNPRLADIAPYGHMQVTTEAIVDAGVDALSTPAAKPAEEQGS